MTEDSEGRERGTDELFEDLDKFFAPIQDVDWPEEGEAGARPGDREPEGGGREAGPSREPPAGEETGVAEDESGAEPVRPGSGVDQPTQEMSADEWDDLRSRFGRGDEPEEEERGEEAREAGPPREGDPYSFMRQFLPEEGEEAQEPLDLEAPGAEEREEEGGLTVDDLRKAPEAYGDLPGPPPDEEGPAGIEVFGSEGVQEEQPAIAEEELTAAMWGEGSAEAPQEGEPGEEPVYEEEELEGEELEGEEEIAVSVVPAADEEPPPGGVEAAAEHFAEAIRESGELPVVSAEGPDSVEGLGPGPEPAGDELEGGFEQEPPAPRTIKVGATDFGPSWQEPTSVEVATEAEREPAAPGRNIPLAFLVGAGLAVIGLGALAISKAAFTVVAGIVVILAQSELYAAVRRRNYQPAVPVGLAFGALTVAAAYLKGEQAMLAMVALSVPFTFLWFMAMQPQRRRGALPNIAMTIFPLLYVPFLAGFLLMTLAASKTLMIAVLGLAVGYDIAAFAIGSWFGERPLAPSISPSKTWEGLVGATLVILLVSIVFLASVDPISTLARAAGLAVIIAVFAPLGDLAESLIKRDLGLKDMGSILPGHGGVLDRIDSVLFAAPAAWYFFRIFF